MAQNPLRADFAHANPVGRHQLLDGITLSRFATTQATAPLRAGAMVIGDDDWEDSIVSSTVTDSAFWELRERWLAVTAAWSGSVANDNASFDWWGNRYRIAHNAMMTARITTLPALYAKMEACDGEPDNTIGGPTGPSLFQVLMWDVLALVGQDGAA